MFRKIAKSIREYKLPSILTPILVSLEVVLECAIPFIVANLVNNIKIIRDNKYNTENNGEQ